MPTEQAVAVVKQAGRRKSEQFNRDKLHGSVLAACLSVRSPLGMATAVAELVCEAVTSWCATRPEITSDDVRRIAADHLDTLHPEAAYLYRNHRLVL